jgi:putative ABC transport system permease protein
MMQDLRHAARLLGRAPGFTLAAILTLALGVGANTAMFSVVHAVMLRPLPYPEPERLIRIRGGSSAPDIEDWRAQAATLEGIAGYRFHFLDLTGGGAAERVDGALVTGELFRVFGARALHGRVIDERDDRPGGEKVLVLGHRFWRDRLGSDPAAVGRTVRFSTGEYQVIGVMPSDFRLPGVENDFYAPLRPESAEEAAARGAHSLFGIARLRADETLAAAQAEMDTVAARLAVAYPEENKDRRVVLAPLHQFLVRDVRRPLVLLLGAVSFVLLIAATNVAGLMLARAAARQKEIAIRASLGAGRGRLARHLLAESLLLAVLGGVAGLVFAHWLVDVVVRLAPPDVPGLDAVRLDPRVLAFTAAVSLATGAGFGLVPALFGSRVSLTGALTDGGRGSGPQARQRLRRALVVSEIALALVLLVGAGLLLRSLHRLQAVDPGFDATHLVTFNLTPPLRTYGDIPRRTRLFEGVLARVAALPGVEAAGAVSELPFGIGTLFHDFVIEGRPEVEPGSEPELWSRTASPTYFATMGLPLLEGRLLSDDDRAGAPLVGVINAAAARRFFPGEDPLGRRFAWARDSERHWIEIVGVVGDVRGQELSADEVPAVYTPLAQEQRPWKTWLNFAVRTRRAPEELAAAVRGELAALDPAVPVTRVGAMEDLIARSVAPRRFSLALLGGFALLALALAGVGLHGLIAYAVALRRPEMGVRMALGAAPRDLLRLVVGEGLALAAAGVALGALGAAVLSRSVEAMLFGIRATDPVTFGAVAALVTAVALLACWRPARRAARVDPLLALRGE